MSKETDGLFVRAASLIKHRTTMFFGAALVPFAVNLIVLFLIGFWFRLSNQDRDVDPVTLWHRMTWTAKVGLMLIATLCTVIPHNLALASISLIVSDASAGRRASLGSALRCVRARLGSLIIVSFAIGCSCLLGFFLLLILGIVAAVETTFIVPSMMIEDYRIGAALRQSLRFGKMRFTEILGLYVVFWLFWMIFVSSLSVLMPQDKTMARLIGPVLFALIPAAIETIVGTALALLFLDTRNRAEALAIARDPGVGAITIVAP